jgi:hypothetical protein
MKMRTPIQSAGEAVPQRITNLESRDEVSKAKATVLTVWLALSSPNYDAIDTAVADTLYQAYIDLDKAESGLFGEYERENGNG